MTIEVFQGHMRLIPWFEKVISDYQKDNQKSPPFSIKEPESVFPGWPLKFSRDIWVWFLDLKKLFRFYKMIIRKAHLSRSRNQNQLFRDDQWNYFWTCASDSLIWKSSFGLSKKYSEKRNFLDQGTRISCSGMTSEVFPGHLRLIPWL